MLSAASFHAASSGAQAILILFGTLFRKILDHLQRFCIISPSGKHYIEQMAGNIQHEKAMPGKRRTHALALLPLRLFSGFLLRRFLFFGLAYGFGVFLPDFLYSRHSSSQTGLKGSGASLGQVAGYSPSSYSPRRLQSFDRPNLRSIEEALTAVSPTRIMKECQIASWPGSASGNS